MADVPPTDGLHSRSASRRPPCQAFHANQLACSSGAVWGRACCFDHSDLSFGPGRGPPGVLLAGQGRLGSPAASAGVPICCLSSGRRSRRAAAARAPPLNHCRCRRRRLRSAVLLAAQWDLLLRSRLTPQQPGSGAGTSSRHAWQRISGRAGAPCAVSPRFHFQRAGLSCMCRHGTRPTHMPAGPGCPGSCRGRGAAPAGKRRRPKAAVGAARGCRRQAAGGLPAGAFAAVQVVGASLLPFASDVGNCRQPAAGSCDSEKALCFPHIPQANKAQLSAAVASQVEATKAGLDSLARAHQVRQREQWRRLATSYALPQS